MNTKYQMIITIGIGISMGIALIGYSSMIESTYKSDDGRLACWFIEDVMNADSFYQLSDFEKEIFELHLKYCEPMPRPDDFWGNY